MPTRPESASAAKGDAARDERARKVLRKFRLIFNTIRAHFRDVERKTGVAGAQVWALAVVRDEPGIGVSALARALDIQQSTASNLLKPLIEAGLVEAERGKTDRRSLHLRITASGLRVLKKAPMPLAGVLPEVLSRLDGVMLKRLETDLDAVISHLEARQADSQRPLG